jgi:hypothetical protein
LKASQEGLDSDLSMALGVRALFEGFISKM